MMHFHLGLGEINLGDLDRRFIDIASYLGCRRFSDCRRDTEPDSVPREAVADGDVAPCRFDSDRQRGAALAKATKSD
jgi:putative ribosome biogenesis GTPase RsgA